jgi:hypothetical protein
MVLQGKHIGAHGEAVTHQQADPHEEDKSEGQRNDQQPVPLAQAAGPSGFR